VVLTTFNTAWRVGAVSSYVPVGLAVRALRNIAVFMRFLDFD